MDLSWASILIAVEWSIRLGMIPVVLRRRFTPSTSLAWLTVIFLLPEVGLVLYLLLGRHRLGRRRLREYREVVQEIRGLEITQRQKLLNVTRPEIDAVMMPVILQAERISGMPILDGNELEFLSDTQQYVDRLIIDIGQAQHHVHLLFYIVSPDEIGVRVGQALLDASQRGVKCRLLADAAGSRHFFRMGGMAGRLRQHGVEVAAALPASIWRRPLRRIDLRNHRKIAVIDGRYAYAGSHNLCHPSYGHVRGPQWVDLSGRLQGPIVRQLQAVFLEDWAYETRQHLLSEELLGSVEPVGNMPAQVVATGPDNEDSDTLLRVIVAAINAAQRKVIITTPYFVPDEPTMLALCMAAERGVEVELVIPQKTDHPIVSAAARAHFDPLLEAGVRIHLHQSGLLHAKTMTVDDEIAFLGSANMDIRSFYLNFESNLLMYGSAITSQLRFAQMRYLGESKLVDSVQWKQRSMDKQLLESAAALLSPLL